MLKIIFMGTPKYSVPYLAALTQSDLQPVMVITQLDKPSGRKGTIQPSPVKQYAVKNGIAVMQPDTVNSAQSIDSIRALKPDLIVVVAFGQIISQAIIDLPASDASMSTHLSCRSIAAPHRDKLLFSMATHRPASQLC